MNELCDRISHILRYESSEIVYQAKDNTVLVHPNCYALSGTALANLAALCDPERRTFILSICSISDPKLELQISL